ncbi:MAG TPA: histidine phosphatase family protein [Burkholderiales bacterium]|nr:histidine phosphatase family protein [Burkholderiales bacterium]
MPAAPAGSRPNLKEMTYGNIEQPEIPGQRQRLSGVVEQALDQAKAAILETEETLRDNAAHATAATQKYVSRNPWKSLAIATSIGFVLALLIRR